MRVTLITTEITEPTEKISIIPTSVLSVNSVVNIRYRSLFPLPVLLLLFACGSTPASAPSSPAAGSPTAAAASAPAAAPNPALRERTTWAGLYLSGVKIGWESSGIEKVAGPGEPGGHYRLKQQSIMRLKTMGVPQESETLLTVDFTSDFTPLSYVFMLTTTSFRVDASGEVKNGVLHTRVKTPQGGREQDIALEKDIDIFGLADIRKAAQGYKVGEVIEGKIFEPNIFGVVPYRIEVIDTELVKLANEDEVVYKVKTTMSSIESTIYLTADGDMIRLEGPMGITMKREPEEIAKNFDASSNITDLILAFSVPADRQVENPSRLTYAVMEIRGLDRNVSVGGAQNVSPADSSGWRTVTVDLGLPVESSNARRIGSAADLDTFLKPSMYIQSDDPRVIAKAREITAGARAPKQKVDMIFQWVFKNVVKEPAFTLPSTVDVLASMRGDCNEHAALFCGLARAARVPTRIAAGLVYMKGRFYYHAWNECYLDGRWVPVDATFGENPADPLRIRMVVGDLEDQMKIAGMAGKISPIRILSTL